MRKTARLWTHGTGAPPASAKALIAGGFGAGKSTLVAAVSEIAPMRTEEYLTAEGRRADPPADGAGGSAPDTTTSGKATTTVALDFGRITLGPDLVFYLFGVPGQERFWPFWDELADGALGAVVLADTRRLPAAARWVEFFQGRGLPYVVAANCFDEAPRRYQPAEVRRKLALAPEVPVLLCDARDRASAKEVLLTMVTHALTCRRA